MLRKGMSLALAILLIHLLGTAGPVFAARQASTPDQLAEKVKIKIIKLGVGEKARATIIMKNGAKLKGYISQAGEKDFIIRDRKTDAPTTVLYQDVAKAESNRGHSTTKTIAIVAIVTVGVVVAIIGISIASLSR